MNNDFEHNRFTAYAFNVEGAAKYAGVSAPTLMEWLNLDDFPAFRSGRRWVIPRGGFEKWLDKHALERKNI